MWNIVFNAIRQQGRWRWVARYSECPAILEPHMRINCAMKHVQREIQIRRCGRENYVRRIAESSESERSVLLETEREVHL